MSTSTSTSTPTPTSPASWSRLVRFRPSSDPTSIAIGEPVSSTQDVGLALYNRESVRVHVYSGTSVLDAGQRTGREEEVSSVLSPLGREEVGTIRCIGLNYESHAIECNLAIPQVPIVFHKPATALADPWPAPTVIPIHTVGDDSADYEAELVVVIGKDAKNVKEEDAMDYVLGYTAANDVSSRVSQFAQSQWNYSKSFDSACPVGPVLVHRSQVESVADVKIKGELSGGVVQDGGLDDLIFSVPKLIAFMSQGTTLPAGTIILTGTPPGIGWAKEPRRMLKHGDEFRVHVSHGVGTLINGIEFEK